MNTGVSGAVLMQAGRPVAFTGRHLQPAETRYSTTDQELLAVIYALRQWRCYLQGGKHDFLLVTDHHPNTYLQTQPTLSRRQARWSELLQEYNFNWQYRPGKHNVADPVSRSPALLQDLQAAAIDMKFDWQSRPAELHGGLAAAMMDHQPFMCAMSASIQIQIPQPRNVLLNAMTRSRASQPNVQTSGRVSQHAKQPAAVTVRPYPAEYGDNDAVRLSMLPDLQAAYESDPDFGDPLDARIRHKHLTARHGLWYHGSVIAIPDVPSLRRQILTELHDSPYAGHGGEHRTIQLVRRFFWWPALDKDCRAFVKGCQPCQRNKAHRRPYAGLLQPHELPSQKWQQVSLDFITGLPKTKHGNSMIMVVMDTLSKMVHFVPCNIRLDAEATAKLYIQRIFSLHGWPKVMITDRDGRFVDAFFRAVCTQLGTQQAMSTAHHHETVGQVERMNRVLEETLRHYVNDKMDNWDDLLPAAEFAVNNSYQASIGTTPFYLNYGYHPSVPLDVGVCPHPDADELLQDMQSVMQATGGYFAFAQQRLHANHIAALVKQARTKLMAARNRAKQYADAKLTDLQFKVGDNVMLKTKNLNLTHQPSTKLFPLWLGPFEIKAKVSAVSYELILPMHWRIHDVFHVNLLKPWSDNGQGHPPSPFTYVAGQPLEYEVDHIVEHYPAIPLHKGMTAKQLECVDFRVRWKHSGPQHDTWEPFSHLKHAPEILIKYGL